MTTRQAAAALHDFGGIYGGIPARVLRPRTIVDAQAAMAEALESGLEISIRAQGHSCNGQTTGHGGVVLDLSGLCGIAAVENGTCDVLASTTWADVIAATLATGQVPPVLPDYLGLTVGGTISIGGLGGTSFREGVIAGQLVSAEVLTAEGALVHCSAEENPALLACIKGGAGQFGVILSARLRLVPAPAEVERVQIIHESPAAMLAAQERLLGAPDLWHLGGWVLPTPQGWMPSIELAWPADLADAGGPAERLAQDLGIAPAAIETVRLPLAAFLHRLEMNPAFPCPRGPDAHAHPWFTAFLPAALAGTFLADLLAVFPAEAMGPAGVVECYPVPTARFLPGSEGGPLPETLFMISAFPCQLDTSAAALAKAEARNQALLRRALELGGLGDPQASAVRFAAEDWRRQLGPHLGPFLAARARFDARGRLKTLPGLSQLANQTSQTGEQP